MLFTQENPLFFINKNMLIYYKYYYFSIYKATRRTTFFFSQRPCITWRPLENALCSLPSGVLWAAAGARGSSMSGHDRNQVRAGGGGGHTGEGASVPTTAAEGEGSKRGYPSCVPSSSWYLCSLGNETLVGEFSFCEINAGFVPSPSWYICSLGNETPVGEFSSCSAPQRGRLRWRPWGCRGAPGATCRPGPALRDLVWWAREGVSFSPKLQGKLNPGWRI